MTFPSITSFNITGPEILFCYPNIVSDGLFMQMMVFAIFCVIAIGLYFKNKERLGDGDFAQSFAVASWVSVIFSILMRLIDCGGYPLLDDITLGVSIGLALLSLLFLFFSDN